VSRDPFIAVENVSLTVGRIVSVDAGKPDEPARAEVHATAVVQFTPRGKGARPMDLHVSIGPLTGGVSEAAVKRLTAELVKALEGRSEE
jgi:hypothetical protein